MIPSIVLIPDFTISAFSTTNQSKKTRIHQQYNAQHYEDWQQLVTSNKIDAIIVAGPPDFNADVVEASLRSGKPIFTEKPCANDTKRLLELVELTNNRNGLVQVGFNFRLSRYFTNLMQLERHYGTPISLDIEYSTNKPLTPIWNYGSVFESFLYAVGIHPIEILCSFLSYKFNYQSHTTHLHDNRFQLRILANNHDRVVTLLTGNHSPRFFASFKATYRDGIVASVNSDQPSLVRISSANNKGDNQSEKNSMCGECTMSNKSLVKEREGSGYQSEMLMFRELITTKEPNEFGLSNSLEVFKVIEQLSSNER